MAADDNENFAHTIGAEVVEADDDRAVVVIDAGSALSNPHGTVHGGAVATLADIAMGAAVRRDDEVPVTVQLTITYLEAAPLGRLTATATVRRRGSRITITEADIIDADGTAVAHAVATFTTIG